MNLEITSEAEAEIQEQFDWYANRDPRVALRLAELFETTIVAIARQPGQFPLMEMPGNPGNVRRARLRGFPLCVLYRVTSNEIEVFAVPHSSRQPAYWRSRLNDSKD
jgi:plasmid stabilization system protein ParE